VGHIVVAPSHHRVQVRAWRVWEGGGWEGREGREWGERREGREVGSMGVALLLLQPPPTRAGLAG